MDWKLELIQIPVADIDRAKAFYTEKAGFNAEQDHQVSDEVRFVQLTPPGSACARLASAARHRMDVKPRAAHLLRGARLTADFIAAAC
jgi:catechol 2,3-dioxygenase-like lactoylglutathione lyase family enzyme